MFFNWLVTTNNSSVPCRVQFCSWMLGTNFKLKMTSAAWRFIPYSRHTHIWLRMLSPKDFLPFTDGVCRRKNSQMKGIHCSHEAKNISRAGDNVRRSAFIKRRRLGRGISSFSPSCYTCNPVAVTGTSVGLLSILYHSPFFLRSNHTIQTVKEVLI